MGSWDGGASERRKGKDQKLNFVLLLNTQAQMSHRYINLKFREGFWAEDIHTNLEVSAYRRYVFKAKRCKTFSKD